MKLLINHSPSALVIVVLLVLLAPTASSSTAASQSALLLEIVYQSPTIPISETIRVYDDGRCSTEGVFVEKAKSGRDRKVFEKVEKQLEADEVAELVGWTQQPDFLNAQREYVVTTVVDYPDWFVVHRYDNQKSIKVINFDRGNQVQRAAIPPSVMKLLRWARPYYFESRN